MTTPVWTWDNTNQAMTLSARTWVQGVQYTPWVAGTNYPWNYQGIIYSVAGTTFDKGQAVACYGQMIKEGNTAPTQLWAGCLELNDQSGIGLTGTNEARIGLEIDVTGNGGTNGGNRAALVVTASRDPISETPVEVTVLGAFNAPGTPEDGYALNGLAVGGQVSVAAIDLSYVTLLPGAVVMQLPDDGPIALSRDSKARVAWNASTSRIEFSYAGAVVMSLDTKGNIRALGTVTGNVTP